MQVFRKLNKLKNIRTPIKQTKTRSGIKIKYRTANPTTHISVIFQDMNS